MVGPGGTPPPPSVETGQISSIFSGNAQMLHQASSGLHQLYGNSPIPPCAGAGTGP